MTIALPLTLTIPRKTKEDLTGMKFGKLIVKGRSGSNKHRAILWECVCECGTVKHVQGSHLRAGCTQSCGCLAVEKSKKRATERVGNKAAHWKGGVSSDNDGYVLIANKDHPRTKQNGYVLEHILVMESMLGRYLIDGEVVHHCNGDRTDNRPYNLRLFRSHSDHMKYHATRGG